MVRRPRSTSRWARRQRPRIALASLAAVSALVGAIALRPDSADVRVLCSNNHASCSAVASGFSQETGLRVDVVRIPTTQALSRLTEPGRSPEFDVWMGGPTDAYARADQLGVLARSDAAAADTTPWEPIYGGILALCMRRDLDLDSWWGLLDADVRIALPHPLTSGTAATFLAFQKEHLGPQYLDYMQRLDRATTTYTDSGVAPAALVADGRVDVGVTFAPYCHQRINDGAPLKVVHPREGTSYEVGAVAVLAGAPSPDHGREFVEFAASDTGQRIGAQAAEQAPVSATLPGHLRAQLATVKVPVLHLDPLRVGQQRQHLIEEWLREVRHGQA